MPSFAPADALLRVGKAKKGLAEQWREGVSLEQRTGRQISELIDRATADRWRLGDGFRRQAAMLMRLSPPMYRDAISRYYYAMYHTMRAATYFDFGGDDHESHSVLPSRVPDSFPNRTYWVNAMKDARTRRNAADYDPYPKSNTAWRKAALHIQGDALQLVPVARQFLVAQGCRYL